VETGYARIVAGQSTHCLVGGAYVSERLDLLMIREAAQALGKDPQQPFWTSDGTASGMNLGTASAFLVLESLEHAQARGAHIYARLDAVLGDRGSREGDRMEQRLTRLADDTGASGGTDTVVFSGASGLPELSARERDFLQARFPATPLRTVGALFGHSVEAHFPMAVALACLALDDDAPISPFAAGEDAIASTSANSAIVTTIGHVRGEGIARLTRMS
jgi:3-oxoacyl-[acyl-carrier-protein] synthase II